MNICTSGAESGEEKCLHFSPFKYLAILTTQDLHDTNFSISPEFLNCSFGIRVCSFLWPHKFPQDPVAGHHDKNDMSAGNILMPLQS
ncbi:hypothetical protein OPV22_029619 [Ensete ventricosum]|uniref:Uncharacterized protein n=1 Tax=Ensete ventricosum TaxID=4639 RepID=A0AAV8P7J0_ENSVE|nr:hypothetical protein OPV22_029619 [Ensete ventricosum]